MHIPITTTQNLSNYLHIKGHERFRDHLLEGLTQNVDLEIRTSYHLVKTEIYTSFLFLLLYFELSGIFNVCTSFKF
jgi:hypothetical protein